MIIEGKEAKSKLLEGINKTANVVKTTLGARGNTVMVVDQLKLSFIVTKDGVTVAKNTVLEDEIENYGSTFIKNAAMKTVDEAGDGTTLTTVLTQALCNNINDELNIGKNPYEIQKEVSSDLDTIKEYIKSKSMKVEKNDQIKQIATISSNNDEEIGSMIGEIYQHIGFEGIINTIETDDEKTEYFIVDGYSMNNTGYVHNIFINNYEKGIVEYDNPKIYVFNNKITNFNSLVPILQKNTDPLSEGYSPTVIICHDIEDSVLRIIMDGISNGRLKEFTVVVSNLISQNRKNRFLDTCAVVGAEYTEDSFGDFGRCERVLIEKDHITFINGVGNKSEYLNNLKKVKKPDTDLKNRIFKLENKAALIKVGGKLPQEIGEKKDRIDDAVLAVKSAIEEGYCAGGETIHLFAIDECSLKNTSVKKALLEPFFQLLSNSSTHPQYILKDIHEKGFGYGYDVKNEKIVNMYEEGIIDSSKVLRVSIENAVHTAINFMFINSIVLP